MIYAVGNQKGGVGKTTTVVNLGAWLGSHGKRVLCVDIDPQGNTTTGFGIKKRVLKKSSYDVIVGKVKIADAIIKTPFEGVSVLPATDDLAGCEIELSVAENRTNRLKMQLLTCKDDYDIILIDCPPALGLLTLNGLTAADEMIIPMLAEFYALEGLSQLTNTLKIVRSSFNPSLKIAGILFVMFDQRLNVSRQVEAEVEKYFPGKVFKTKIPRNVRISEAPSHGKPVLYYDKGSKGSEAYEELGYELLNEEKPEPEKKKKHLFFGKKKKDKAKDKEKDIEKNKEKAEEADEALTEANDCQITELPEAEENIKAETAAAETEIESSSDISEEETKETSDN